MAVAALQVLGMTEHVAERLPPDRFVPAVGQGCVAVEVRADDAATRELLAAVDDPTTRHQVEVERSYLAELGTGCSLPLGAHVDGSTLYTFLAGADGTIARDAVALGLDQGDHELARRAARSARDAVGA